MQDLFAYLNQFWLAVQSGQAPAEHIWVYLALVLLVMVEGPVAILLAAGLSSAGFLNPMPVFAAAMLGNLIADSLWYSLGYFGKIDWVLRRRKWFGVDPDKLEALKRVINRHAVKLLMFSKVSNGLIVPVLIATGVARVSWRRWFPIIFLTNLLTSLVMVMLGYYLASSLLKVQDSIRYVGVAFTVIFLLAASFYLRRYLGRTDILDKLEPDAE